MKNVTMITTGALLSAMLVSGPALSGFDRDAVGDGDRIRIQEYPGTILNLPNWVAIDRGFCAERNLQCSTVRLESGPLGLQTLAARNIEVSWASNDVNMQAVAQGLDVQLVLGHIPNNHYVLNVRDGVPLPNRDAGYPDVMEDLKGLNMGVTARGSAIEIQAKALLRGAGMHDDDMTYVAVGSTATSYPAMIANQIQATVSFEPFNTLCEVQETCHALVTPGAGEGPPEMQALNGGFQGYIMRREFIENNGQVAHAFMATMEETINWMKDPDNFDEVMDIARENFSLGDLPGAEEVMERLVENQIAGYGTTVDRASIDAMSEFLMANELIAEPISSDVFVYVNAPHPE